MKIKEIKIREDDGSYSDPIPVGADSLNVDYENTNVKNELDKLNSDNNTNKQNINNLQSNLNATKDNLNVQTSRIDNLSTLSEGSTTGDAEIIDARVGNNGTTYTNLGTAIRTQINNMFQGYPTIINSLSELANFNNALSNRVYIVNVTGIENQPDNEKGTLITFAQKPNYNSGGIGQIYFGNNMKIYYRMRRFSGGVVWSEWQTLWCDFSKGNEIIKIDKNSINESDTTITDLDNVETNRIYVINKSTVLNIPEGKKGTLFCYSVNNNQVKGGRVQLYVSLDTEFYFRATKFASQMIWSPWQKINTIKDNKPTEYNGHEISVFNKILCIGDSTTEGCSNYTIPTSGNKPFPNYAYPKQLSKITGVEAVNLGKAGYSTKSWYEFYQNEDLSGYDCAIIHLGINDPSRGITTEQSTQALQNIITKLKNENSHIKIFVCSIIPCYHYEGGANYNYYNTITESMKTICTNDESCFFLDMNKYSKVTTSYAHGHPFAVGYNVWASEIANYISYTIKNNISSFDDIQFANTNYDY